MNSKNLICGERICLRRLTVADASEKYLRWLNDPKVNQFLESRFQKWSIKKLRDNLRTIGRSREYLFLAIILKESGEHIGNLKIGPINPIHRFADLGIIIGEKSFWGRGYASEAIKLAADYSFKKLKLNKLTAGAYANNLGSTKAFGKAGFHKVAKFHRHRLYQGKYVDEIVVERLKVSPRKKNA